jgi:hypothetical protein
MQDAAPRILKREYFKADSIRGTYPYEGKNLDYAIYSYSTPIALFHGGQWYMTTKRFSQTTTNQQAALRLILRDEHVIQLSQDVFEHQCKEAGIS